MNTKRVLVDNCTDEDDDLNNELETGSNYDNQGVYPEACFKSRKGKNVIESVNESKSNYFLDDEEETEPEDDATYESDFHKEAQKSDNEELSKASSSSSNQRLRIDPNYKWLLKDLNLSNNRRVIDVTEIIDQNETKELEPKLDSEDEYKNDHNYISKLYEKIVGGEEVKKGDVNKISDESIVEQEMDSTDSDDSVVSDDEDYDVDKTEDILNSEAYKEWRVKKNDATLDSSQKMDELENGKKQFSKSFEVSIEDLDKMINRVNSGIKLKRAKGKEEEEEAKIEDVAFNGNNKNDVVDSLKQEWSMMFTKLEQEYKAKLEEQQQFNEMKMKQLHDEIKQSIQLQTVIHQQQQAKESINLKSTITIQSRNETQSVSTSTSPMIGNNNNNNNSSNSTDMSKQVRLELKNKHARHVQDLRDYYEKELDEVRKRLSFYEAVHNNDAAHIVSLSQLNEINENLGDEESSKSRISKNQQILNNELKNSNNELLHNFYESSRKVQLLTHENYDLTKKLNEARTELEDSNEKMANLEHCCTQLEIQLTETIKLQDVYVRELHSEKRNFLKKAQECEELKMNLKFYEQKCQSFELKLEEKDSCITRLKTKLIQLETDLTRLEYDYKKLITTKYSTSNNAGFNEAQQKETSNKQPALQTKNSMSNVNNISPSSSSSISPNYLNEPHHQASSATSLPIHNQLRSASPSTNTKFQNNNSHASFTYNDNANSMNDNYQPQSDSHRNRRDLSNPPLQRNISASPRRFIERNERANAYNENSNDLNGNYSARYSDFSSSNENKTNPQSKNQQQQLKSYGSLFTLQPEKQLKYIQQLESDFDMLMKHKQQLDAQLTRFPYKTTNTSMHALRESVENELNLVEKKLASVKLELRKLNIIKSH